MIFRYGSSPWIQIKIQVGQPFKLAYTFWDVIVLLKRTNFSNKDNRPIGGGSEPEIKLLLRSRDLNLSRFPKESGNWPLNSLSDKSIDIKFLKWPNDSGNLPRKRFSLKSNSFRVLLLHVDKPCTNSIPSSELIPFSERSKISKLQRFPQASWGIGPLIPAWLRWRIVR